MQRFFLNLAVVLLGYLVIPANLTAGGAKDGEECGLIFFGSVCVDKGEYDEAIAYFNRVIRMNPKNSDAYGNRGIAWHKKGEYDKAIADYSESIRLNPNVLSGWVYTNRGITWVDKGEYDKAIADYNQALTVESNYANATFATAYSNLAWLQATCPDEKYRNGRKAFENASKAYQLGGGKNWSIVGTVAAAYAESGDFEKAKEWQAKAIELAKADKTATDKDKAEASSCLELYKQGKRYREELKRK